MVDADTCGHSNDYYERIAKRADRGKLSLGGMDAIHHRKGYTSYQGADNHDRHVGIKCLIRMLMEFNIGGIRKPGHCASKPYPVYD
jgi:hypothetical protein